MTYLRDGEAFRTMPDGSVVKLDKDEVIRDGQRIHVPLYLADASKPGTQAAPIVNADHARPRQGTMTDAQIAKSVASHHKLTERTANAWKNPTLPPQQDSKPAAPVAAAPVADAGAAYEKMKQRQEDAWKNPKPV
jgi:hypothetical protein